MKLAFFGSAEFSVYVLEELKRQNIVPDLIITTPDTPRGRKLVFTPNEVKVWAEKEKVSYIEFDSLKDGKALQFLNKEEWDLFLVASYGKIIPKEIFDLPKRKTLNIHPSLLPKYRGPSPIVSQILNDEENIGVSIMKIEEGVDTGPIVKQAPLPFARGGERGEVEKLLAEEGAKLFAEILPQWLSGYLQATPQETSQATFTKKIEKKDGLLNLEDDARKNFLKVKAYQDWPTSYFFVEKKGKKMRVIVTEVKIENSELKILRVIPEGKKEMNYEDFLRGLK